MASNQNFAIYPSLRERVVVISGGATGIGASMVVAFARQGAQVVFLDVQDGPAAELVRTLGDDHQVTYRPVFHHCNLVDIEGSVRPVATAILVKFPEVHVLINNAAADARQPTLDITPEQWDRGVAINLRHIFFLTQALIPGLLTAAATGPEAGRGASVINMGSISWAIPAIGQAPYIASKSAILGLTRSLAHEFGPRGVRVNSIMPGAIATERQKREIITPEYEAHFLGRQALKRVLQPDEIARLALWLASDDSSAVTNQSIVADAGWI